MMEGEARRPRKRVSEKEKRLARKLLCRQKDIEEVSNLPKLDPEDETPMTSMVEESPPPRFWEVWCPKAPKTPSYTPTKTPVPATPASAGFMGTLRAPVVVEEMVYFKEIDEEERTVKIILGSKKRVVPRFPRDSAEAQFPSRRTGGRPLFRYAPRLVFPSDVREAREDETHTIGDDFEVGDYRVTEVQPNDGRERRASAEVRGSLPQVRQRSSFDGRGDTRTSISGVSGTCVRRNSSGSDQEQRTSVPREEETAGTAAGRLSTVSATNEKHETKRVSIVKVPAITQEQWGKIQHAYKKMCPPPAAISRHRQPLYRTRKHVRYPVGLPDPFKLLHDIEAVERLPDIAEQVIVRDGSNASQVTCMRILSVPTSERRHNTSSPSASSDNFSWKAGRKGFDEKRHSSVLYYVDPAIRRESLDPYGVPMIDEEDTRPPPDYEFKKSAIKRRLRKLKQKH